MKRNTFVAALTAAIVSAAFSVSISHALSSGGTPVYSTTPAPGSLSQIQTLIAQEQMATVGQLNSLTALVNGIGAQVKIVNSTVTALAPVLHSIAERQYAMCWMLSDLPDVTPQVPGEKGVQQERMNECYQAFFTFSQFRPDDLYSAKAPVMPG